MCEARPGGWFAHLGEFAAWSYVKLLLLGLSVPACILVLGIAALWLVRLSGSRRPT